MILCDNVRIYCRVRCIADLEYVKIGCEEIVGHDNAEYKRIYVCVFL